MTTVVPAEKIPIEKKVTWGSVGAYLGGIAIMAVLNAVSSDGGLVSALPDWLEVFVIPVVPAMVAFISGWIAKHTPRPDLPATNVIPHDGPTG